MIDYHEAVKRLTEGAERLGVQVIPSGDALFRVLAAPVVSQIALPPFDNAAVDGVALVTRGVPVPRAKTWEIGARIGAGDAAPSDDALAWEIMTGAPLPAHADSVVPVERIETLPATTTSRVARIRVQGDVVLGANIRRRGEDVQPGQSVLPMGQVLEAAALMLVAGLGIDQLPVARRPRVVVLATGREIVAGSAPLPPGCIHDASSPYLALALAAAGAQLVRIERVGDELNVFQAALEAALTEGIDLVLSTGAVSKGCYDFVPAALKARNATILFHGVAIRPGKPVLAARLREGPLFVGLPGNPMSTAVGFRFLVEPLLRAWLGLPQELPCWLPLAEDCRSKIGMHTAYHGMLRCDAEGRLRAYVAQAQGSFRLLPYTQASAWITLPAEASDVSAGTPVSVHGLSHLRSPGWTPI